MLKEKRSIITQLWKICAGSIAKAVARIALFYLAISGATTIILFGRHFNRIGNNICGDFICFHVLTRNEHAEESFVNAIIAFTNIIGFIIICLSILIIIGAIFAIIIKIIFCLIATLAMKTDILRRLPTDKKELNLIGIFTPSDLTYYYFALMANNLKYVCNRTDIGIFKWRTSGLRDALVDWSTAISQICEQQNETDSLHVDSEDLMNILRFIHCNTQRGFAEGAEKLMRGASPKVQALSDDILAKKKIVINKDKDECWTTTRY